MSLMPKLEIDLGALAANYRSIIAASAPAEVAAVVKADAYGLGVAPVARCLLAAGCRRFFVATVGEGAELRGIVPDGRIYVLDGPLGDAPDEFSRHALIPVLNSLGQVHVWGQSGPAALHLDTGMNRLGLSGAELASLAKSDPEFPRFELDLVMTHLACGDEPEHPLNGAQITRFGEALELLPDAPISIGNSAGALTTPKMRGDVVRAGIALYGGNPFVDRDNPMAPVVSLNAPIIQIRTLDSKQPIGYGASYIGAKGARIATVALGYADGYPRVLGNRGVASLCGVRVPVVGRVSMDLVCIDVSSVPRDAALEGGYVEFFGHGISIDEVAAAAGTISYELLTGIGRRVERCYRGVSRAVDSGETASV